MSRTVTVFKIEQEQNKFEKLFIKLFTLSLFKRTASETAKQNPDELSFIVKFNNVYVKHRYGDTNEIDDCQILLNCFSEHERESMHPHRR